MKSLIAFWFWDKLALISTFLNVLNEMLLTPCATRSSGCD